MRYLIFILITSFSFAQESLSDSISFYYPTNEFKLTTTQKNNLQDFFSKTDGSEIQNTLIKGYTDFVGSEEANKILAQKRTESISKFLIDSLAIKSDLLALGEIKNNLNFEPKEGIAEDRKTTVLIKYKNFTIVTPKNNDYSYLEKIDSLQKGDKITLKNINFKLGSAIITRASIPELNKLVKIMTNNKNLDIEIEGHVCCGHKIEVKKQKMTPDNKWLSGIRAESIYNFLIEKGIDSIRLKHKGYGFTKPLVYPETNEKDRYENRRIELSVISNNHLEDLTRIEVGESVILRNITFAWGKEDFTPESFPEIINLYDALDNFPNLKVEIQGHVCCSRKEYATGEKKSQHNIELSTKRALNIVEKLTELGIDPKRLSYKGFGFSKPKIFPEKNSEDKKVNRRIEVVLLER